MITEIPVGTSVIVNGYTFTLTRLTIDVSTGTKVFASIPVLDSNGLRCVRTQEQFEVQIAFWLKDWEDYGQN